jgi:hypothetical protein
MKKIVFAAVFSTFIATHAIAMLVSTDDQQWGIDSVTVDLNTGLEWLDVTKSYGTFPYSQLLNDLLPGNKFDGWNIASASQVLALLDSAGLPSDAAGFKDVHGKYTTQMTEFQNLLGNYTTCNENYHYTWGIVSDSEAEGSISRIWLDQLNEYDEPQHVLTNVENNFYGVESLTTEDFNENNSCNLNPMGAWLVRSPVPEPSAIIIFGSGIAVLTRLSRKKRKVCN